MTENGKELEEVRRAHAQLESRFDAVIPTLATKADLEATARQLSTETRHEINDFRDAVERRFEQVDRRFEKVDRRFEEVDRQLKELQAKMAEGFTRLTSWMAGTIVALLIALLSFLSAVWSRTPQPVTYVYPAPATAPAPAQLAPPSQP